MDKIMKEKMNNIRKNQHQLMMNKKKDKVKEKERKS